MSIVPFLLITQTAQMHRRNMRRSALNRMHHNSSSSKSQGYSDSDYSKSYVDCVIAELDNDDVLKNFFENLLNNVQSYREEQGSEKKKEGEDILALLKGYCEGRAELVRRLNELGVKVEEFRPTKYDVTGFELDTKKRYDSVPTGATFNGIGLTLDELDNPKFEEEYENQKTKCDEIRANLPKLERKIKIQRILDKIIGSEKTSSNLRVSTSEKMFREDDLYHEEQLKKRLDTYKSFTPEQLQEIHKYLEATQYIEKAINLLKTKIGEFESAIPDISEKRVIEEALSRTMAELGLGEEEIAEIYKRLDRVAIRRFRGEYDDDKSYSRDFETPQRRMLRGFIKHVYEEDPEFVDRNMDQVIEDEKTREDE